jgi:hypothetical protein
MHQFCALFGQRAGPTLVCGAKLDQNILGWVGLAEVGAERGRWPACKPASFAAFWSNPQQFPKVFVFTGS